MNWTEIAWNCLYALLIFAAGNVLSAWLRDAAALALERTSLDALVRRLVVSLVRPVVVTLATLAALAQLGIPLSTFAAMVGAITLAVGMAMRSTLSNVASGALLLSIRPFEVGDSITAAGEQGVVGSLGLFHTTLLTAGGDTVTCPNDTVWSGSITNRSDRASRRIQHRWVLVPNTDIQRASTLIQACIQADERVLDEPAPAIRFDVDELGVVVVSSAHVPNAEFASTRSDLCHDILIALRKADIQLATRSR